MAMNQGGADELEEEERWSDWEESEGEGGGMETGGGFLPLCVPSTSSADDGTLFGTAREAFDGANESGAIDKAQRSEARSAQLSEAKR